MSKQLTRLQLDAWNIKVEKDENSPFGYKIQRFGKKTRRSKEEWITLSICVSGSYHPYSDTVIKYPIVAFNDGFGKHHTYTLSKLVYAYYNYIVPEHMDVDHIDGNTFNNDLSNLQLLTRKENLKKRRIQANQYNNSKSIAKL